MTGDPFELVSLNSNLIFGLAETSETTTAVGFEGLPIVEMTRGMDFSPSP